MDFPLRLIRSRFVQGLQQALQEPHDESARRLSRSEAARVRRDGGFAAGPGHAESPWVRQFLEGLEAIDAPALPNYID